MSFPFPVEPILRAVNPRACDGGKQQYVLERDFSYDSSAFGRITAPEGMQTDFASVPRVIWSYLSPEDPCILWGSLIHDYLYAVGGQLALRRLTRAECDSVLREAMLVCGARSTQAAVVYRCLRAFGGGHWPNFP
jgi:hypothetical protein